MHTAISFGHQCIYHRSVSGMYQQSSSQEKTLLLAFTGGTNKEMLREEKKIVKKTVEYREERRHTRTLHLQDQQHARVMGSALSTQQPHSALSSQLSQQPGSALHSLNSPAFCITAASHVSLHACGGPGSLGARLPCCGLSGAGLSDGGLSA